MRLSPPKETYVLTWDATRDDLEQAIAAWERGIGVTGPRTLALYRYWERRGPDIISQGLVDDFEYVRRALETTEPSRRQRAVACPADYYVAAAQAKGDAT